MKFSISSKKNQQANAVELLCISADKIKSKIFTTLGKNTAELAGVLATQCDDKKNFHSGFSDEGMPHRFAVWQPHIEQLVKNPEKSCSALIAWLKAGDETHLSVHLDGLNKKDAATVLSVLMRAFADHFYTYDKWRTKDSVKSLQAVDFVTENEPDINLQAAFTYAFALTHAMDFARDMANAPANVCTPDFLAQSAKDYGSQVGVKTKIYSPDQIAKLGMNAFLAVAQGSHTPARFIEMTYSGGKKSDAPIVLVGKGITFDSGGISLKPGANMDEMKYDMCGAASVIGAICAAARLHLPLNIVALVPACENMPSGHAARPGDIIKTLNGLTVEILNTDAEGRLILCDALAYAENLKPQAVIDVATLTGACVIALGHVGSAVLGNQADLINHLKAASERSGDKVWELPLWEEYRESLKSNFADIANIGGREGGTITAAVFLSYFAEKYSWAHLDIAGTAWNGGKNKGATGRPIPLLLQYLIDRC